VVGLAAQGWARSTTPGGGSVEGPEETRAFCRSIAEFHITDALDQCKDSWCGTAAMLRQPATVRNENPLELVSRLNEIARERPGARPETHPNG
jgi:hypothetical protein